MPYLTYADYQFWGNGTVAEEDFPKILDKASDVIDSVTRAFYRFNDIEQDVPYRREQFKKAVAAQIDYFVSVGTTSADMLMSVQSVAIGRTNVSVGGGGKQASVLSTDARLYLMHTGLLYRGVSTL